MKKQLRFTLLSAVIFFAATMPFRELFRVMAVTEMRPASALPPALGLMWGVPGAVGCAVGNLAADLLSGYAPSLCAWGFVTQLVFGLFPLALWRLIQRQAGEEPATLRLNNVKNVMRYLAMILADALLMALMLGLILQLYGLSPLFSTTTAMLFLNNVVFGVILGVPLVVFMTVARLGRVRARMSLSERFVLLFLLLSVAAAGMVGAVAYVELSPHAESPLAMWNTIYVYVLLALTVLFVMTLFILRSMERTITIPIEGIADVAKSYVSGGKQRRDSGEAALRCEAYTVIEGETGALAEAFRTMLLDLDAYMDNLTAVTAEKERIGAELDVATKIQASMLPCIFPAFPEREEFDIYASMQPAKEVGGDFYDFFLVDENTLAVVMADVSGKGVPAALFMVIAKTLIKNNAQNGESPASVFETVNDLLCENNEAGMFVTAFMGYLDVRSGRFTFVNAGHNPPLLRQGGKLDRLKMKKGFVLAGMEEMRYRQDEITLRPGDELFLYTDGVTEAMNGVFELFGEARLLDVMNKSAGLALTEVLSGIKREIDAFADGAEQADDITMLSLRYTRTLTEELTVPAERERLAEVQDFVSARLDGCTDKLRNRIAIAVDEIFTNIASYAYGEAGGDVCVRLSVADDVTIELEDSGIPYNPLSASEPDLTLPAEEREIGGLGVFMVKKLMDSVEYRREGEKNVLTVRVRLPL